MKKTSYSNQTLDLFNILPKKHNTLLSPLLQLLQATQKKVQMVVRPTRSPWQELPSRRTKFATFQLLFQSREQVVVWWGQIRWIGWVIKTLETQVGQFLLGCKCPVSRGIVVQEQDNPGVLIVLFVFLCKNPKIFAEVTVLCWWIVR